MPAVVHAVLDAINRAREEAQAQAVREYEAFRGALKAGEETPSPGTDE